MNVPNCKEILKSLSLDSWKLIQHQFPDHIVEITTSRELSANERLELESSIAWHGGPHKVTYLTEECK